MSNTPDIPTTGTLVANKINGAIYYSPHWTWASPKDGQHANPHLWQHVPLERYPDWRAAGWSMPTYAGEADVRPEERKTADY